jgi:phosphoribosylformylglycinamidine synthase
MKFGVITFPGSNCDQDLIYVLKDLMGCTVVHLWHKDTDLQGCDFVMLPGGFAHGDYLRTGAIARFSPIMAEVVKHAARGGLVMGICNGFQILCEAGLLPGVLRRNAGLKYICDHVYLTPAGRAAKTYNWPKQALKVPIAHGEGNYYCDAQTLQQIEDNGQVWLRYCGPHGAVTAQWNPNGSLNNIAGITNAAGNVMGLMPHPERAADPILGETDGRIILQQVLSLVAAVV